MDSVTQQYLSDDLPSMILVKLWKLFLVLFHFFVLLDSGFKSTLFAVVPQCFHQTLFFLPLPRYFPVGHSGLPGCIHFCSLPTLVVIPAPTIGLLSSSYLSPPCFHNRFSSPVNLILHHSCFPSLVLYFTHLHNVLFESSLDFIRPQQPYSMIGPPALAVIPAPTAGRCISWAHCPGCHSSTHGWALHLPISLHPTIFLLTSFYFALLPLFHRLCCQFCLPVAQLVIPALLAPLLFYPLPLRIFLSPLLSPRVARSPWGSKVICAD